MSKTPNEMHFEALVENIYLAIDTEVGEKRELKPDTEEVMDLVQRHLAIILDLPEDHHL